MLQKYLILLFYFCSINYSCTATKLKFYKVQEKGIKNFNRESNNLSEIFESYRLPNNTVPIHYDIFIITDVHLRNFNFFGTVTIDIEALEDSSTITIHAKQLTITYVDLFDINSNVIEWSVDFELFKQKDFLVIKPKEKLLENTKYKVRIKYWSILRTDDYGFFRGSYVNENGREIWFASTHLQATDARHTFPCYDEPNIRTSFDIRVRHHEDYFAISNMPAELIIPSPVKRFMVTKFKRIPSMQTYLVALTVADFSFIENTNVIPPQRIYARPQVINGNKADFAFKISPDIMLACENYFGRKFSFPKMDQVVMTQLEAGSMENWGLVMYSEGHLLFDPKTKTTEDKEFVIRIIAHEFVWINEGFATLYAYLMSHSVFPEERFNDLFLVDVMHYAMEIDAVSDIRPMSLYVEDPKLISLLFDSVAYEKAASVLHMFMHALGTEVWQEGIRNFIADRYNNYGNSDHLYKAIQRAVNNSSLETIDVENLMNSWEDQPGLPLLYISIEDENTIKIHQERFTYDKAEKFENLWSIPINYATAENPDFESTNPKFWLTSENDSLEIDTRNWTIFNIQQNFFYRVNYDLTLWKLIITQLNYIPNGYEKIHTRNRAQLIDDSFHLAQSYRLKYSVVFEIMNYLWQETDYIPWRAVYNSYKYLNLRLCGSTVYLKFQEFFKHNADKLLQKLGVESNADEMFVDRYGRSIIVSIACESQHEECLQQTNQKLVDFLENDGSIAPDYVSLIYCNGMRVADDQQYKTMKNLFYDSKDEPERIKIIDGISCVQKMEILENFLNLTIQNEIDLSIDEKVRILTVSASNGENSQSTIMDFVIENFITIESIKTGLVKILLENLALYIGSSELNSKYNNLLAMLLRNQAITPIDFFNLRNEAQVNLNWQSKHIVDIGNFFYEWKPQD